MKKGIISVTSAGISELLALNEDGKLERHLVEGPFLGMFDDIYFENKHFPLIKGTAYIFYSDGLEMSGVSGQMHELEAAPDFIHRTKLLHEICHEAT